jgi:hypothetical protein
MLFKSRFLYFYCVIGTPQLAEPAADTLLGPLGKDFAVMERQHVFRAKGHANIAALAPSLANDMFEGSFRLFAHSLLSYDDMPPRADGVDDRKVPTGIIFGPNDVRIEQTPYPGPANVSKIIDTEPAPALSPFKVAPSSKNNSRSSYQFHLVVYE